MSEDGIKANNESAAHYVIRQLLLIESMRQPDEAFGTTARGILTGLRRKLEDELLAAEAKRLESGSVRYLPPEDS